MFNDNGNLQSPKKARLRGPFPLASWLLMVMVMAMMPTMAGMHANRLQFAARYAGSDVQPGLPLHTDWLQRIGISRAAEQKVASEAHADRRIGADAAVTSRKAAVPDPVGRSVRRPGELRLIGETQIDADPLHGGNVSLRTLAFALEDALEASGRTDDEADILAALAFKHTNLDTFLSVRGRV